jgi:hypothetical protein
VKNIAASFPQLRNQGLYHSGEERIIRLKVMLASFTTAPDNLYMAPRPSFALRAATWNLHTTQPSTLFPTCDEVVNLTGLLETKGMCWNYALEAIIKMLLL